MHRLRSRQDSMAGGLAQLVERLLCKQDVSGSSPLTSIQHIQPEKVWIGEGET
jgi:hypothetical protein